MVAEDMNWYIWEAVLIQIEDMASKKIIPTGISLEARTITKEIAKEKRFTPILRERACLVMDAMIPFEKEWRVAVDKEYEDMLKNEIEMRERDQRLQQGVSEGASGYGLGA